MVQNHESVRAQIQVIMQAYDVMTLWHGRWNRTTYLAKEVFPLIRILRSYNVKCYHASWFCTRAEQNALYWFCHTSLSYLVPFTYEKKTGTIQRRLAWPLHKDDTLFRSGRSTGLNIFFPFFLLTYYMMATRRRISISAASTETTWRQRRQLVWPMLETHFGCSTGRIPWFPSQSLEIGQDWWHTAIKPLLFCSKRGNLSVSTSKSISFNGDEGGTLCQTN